jgi:hypothetical protein
MQAHALTGHIVVVGAIRSHLQDAKQWLSRIGAASHLFKRDLAYRAASSTSCDVGTSAFESCGHPDMYTFMVVVRKLPLGKSRNPGSQYLPVVKSVYDGM